MKQTFAVLAMVTLSGSTLPTQQTTRAPQTETWIGTISDSKCAGSHVGQPHSMTSRECIFECVKARAKLVLVDGNGKVYEIANQDLPGLPLYIGRPVRLLGERRGERIAATIVEAYPPHLHMLHVMANWRDTPGGVGLLIAAMSEAKVAVTHAKLASADASDLAGIKLHTGHVLNALDPDVESKGPGAGYGVRKGAAGAQQHLNFAIKAEGATARMIMRAPQVVAPLSDVDKWTAEAVTVGQRVREAATAAEAAPMVRHLAELTTQVADGLARAHTAMQSMLKEEDLEHAPR
jgi:hypothetical protein